MERLLDEVSFHAPEMDGCSVDVDGAYVDRMLAGHCEERRLVALHPVRRRALRRLGAVSLVAVSSAACGKKGNPLPPLEHPARPCRRFRRVVERRSRDAPVHRSGGEPGRSHRRRARADRDLSRRHRARCAGAAARRDRWRRARTLRGQIAVRRAGRSACRPPGHEQPLPGEPASFVDVVDSDGHGLLDVRRRSASMGRNRRGPPSPPITVPLAALPVAPTALDRRTNNETTLTLSWQRGRQGLSRVLRDRAARSGDGTSC